MKFNNQFNENVYRSKYMLDKVDKELIDPLKRIDKVVTKYYPHLKGKAIEYGTKKWIGFAGGLFRSAMNPNKSVSAVNCTTLAPPEDNLESISKAWYLWAKFAASGQGEGIDMSKLRPDGAIVHNASNTSTGPISFMRTFDGILKEIAQQGRRGASLISLDINHPDIPEFIKVKDEEGILETANISIRVNNKFMKAVENNEEWEFKFKNKYETISKKTSAKKLFRLIAEHAWKSGDPGLLFWDTSVKYSNSDYLGYPIVGVNACSEQVLDYESVCLLSAVNLARFEEYGEEGYLELISYLSFALDAFRREEIKEERSPSKEQIKKMIDIPRIGIGVLGLADYFIRKGITYGDKNSLIEAKYLFGTLSGEAYSASYDIAKNYDKKSFPAYDKEQYKKSPFIKRLLKDGFISENILDFQAHVCKTTVAPTGTGQIITEAGGAGIEPIFGKYYVRRERATTGDWKEWFNFNDLVVQELTKQGLEITKENADNLDPKIWKTAHSINNDEKLELMKVVQRYIDSAVSVTYNLKEDVTVEEIEHIYMTAWKNEAKGVTVYREGSKAGVLITEANYNKAKPLVEEEIEIDIPENHTQKRPKDLKCDIHKAKYKGENYVILVGMRFDRPWEIFVTKDLDQEFDFHKHKTGITRKVKKGQYSLILVNGEEKTIIEDIKESFDSVYGTLSRFVSMGLRHHNPIQAIVEQLGKDTNFMGFARVVSRVLKKYIEEGTKSLGNTCSECGSDQLIYEEGCLRCQTCGNSLCS